MIRSTGIGALVALYSLTAPALASVPQPKATVTDVPSTDAPATDMLSRMFTWWDGAFKTPGAFTEENFGRFFTPDATLTIGGRRVITGLAEWVSHFDGIQSRGGVVEIVVPFKKVFQVGDDIYTYHVIRARRDGRAECTLAAGHATLRDGKIASIVLVRSPMDEKDGPLDPQCWTN